jgi:hypothetical protein
MAPARHASLPAALVMEICAARAARIDHDLSRRDKV